MRRAWQRVPWENERGSHMINREASAVDRSGRGSSGRGECRTDDFRQGRTRGVRHEKGERRDAISLAPLLSTLHHIIELDVQPFPNYLTTIIFLACTNDPDPLTASGPAVEPVARACSLYRYTPEANPVASKRAS